ncbi:MAG: alpha/beta fold hydrolase [Dehalococcoidia bacterium]
MLNSRLRVAAATVTVSAGIYAALAAAMATGLLRTRRIMAADTPAAVGLEYRSVTFPSRHHSTALCGWLVKPPARADDGDNAPSPRWVVMVHGFGANRTDPMAGALGLAKDLHARGYGLLMFDLRGCGESGGTAGSAGFYEHLDLLGALDFLESTGVDRSHMGVIGFSLGGAVALMACATPGVAGAVVADSAFADLWMIIRDSTPRLDRPMALVNPGVRILARLLYGIDMNRVSPAQSVASSSTPVMIIHGGSDLLVPVEHARVLGRALRPGSGSSGGVWIVPGAAHVQSYRTSPATYVSRVTQFFEQTLSDD